MPGPAVWDGAGSGGSSPAPEPVEEEEPVTPAPEPVEDEEPGTPAPGADCSNMYGQCGGREYAGATCCSTGKCQVVNDWYHQCI